MRLVVPVFAPIGEEPGWRGFALPRLQRRALSARRHADPRRRRGALARAAVFLAEENLAPIFLLATVAVTFFYTWLFNHTGGSVFMTIVAHAAEGVVGATFIGDDGLHGANETRFTVLYTVGWCVVAVVLVVFDRTMWRTTAAGPLVDGEAGRAAVPLDRRHAHTGHAPLDRGGPDDARRGRCRSARRERPPAHGSRAR